MPLIEIYRSTAAAACEQRALVLRAMGMRSEILLLDGAFLLMVEPEAARSAEEQLRQYDTENIAKPTPAQLPKPRMLAWLALASYAFILIGAGYFAGIDAFNFNWYARGALSSAARQQHEVWRVVTALTLHVDHGHLIRNIGFGALFLYPVARFLGFGVALLATVFAAAIANLIDAYVMPATHIAVGASTMVFAALGLLSAYSWRVQWMPRLRWTQRWAPLIMGIALLGLIGSGGENVDVIAHLAGFFCGAVLATTIVRMRSELLDNLLVQLSAATGAFTIFIVAWLWARISAQ